MIYDWLVAHHSDLVEDPLEEHRRYLPENGMLLQPRKIVMPAGPEKTHSELRKQGVDAIEFDTTGIPQGGINGIRCITCRLIREAGPEAQGNQVVSVRRILPARGTGTLRRLSDSRKASYSTLDADGVPYRGGREWRNMEDRSTETDGRLPTYGGGS